LELIYEESQTHSDVEEENVSKYEDNLDVNSECSDYESEFEDGLHSEYAPQGAPQMAAGAAQEPATGRASQTYLSKNGFGYVCTLTEGVCLAHIDFFFCKKNK